MPAPHDNTPAQATPVPVRLVRVILVMAGIVAVVVLAVVTSAISLPHFGNSSHPQASPGAGLAAQQEAANRQWAAATCTNVLEWKNEIQRDGTSLNLGFGPSARINNAITATRRLLNQLNTAGLPPAAKQANARAQIEQLHSDIETRLRAIEDTASSAASGHLLAIASLISDLGNYKTLGTQIASELRHVVSVNLGVSLAETRACRQLVGIPI